MKSGIGSHQSAKMLKCEWFTPPWIIRSLGRFDLDPCSHENRPWETADIHYYPPDDGLSSRRVGRIWLNPPYGSHTSFWLRRLASHGNGIALIFARTETTMFFENVWRLADALLFFRGRIHFHHLSGDRSATNAGAPSVLIAYGKNNKKSLQESGIPGKYIDLNRRARR